MKNNQSERKKSSLPFRVNKKSFSGLISLVFTLKNFIEKMLSNNKLWLLVSHIHANIYTIYLWHLFIFFITYMLGGNILLVPVLFITISLFFGNYERSIFKLSSNLLKRVNPLQPWPSPQDLL